MYIKITEARLYLHIPPTNGSVIRVSREYTIIDHYHVVNVHYMTNIHVRLLNSILGVHVIDSDSVIKTSNNEFFAYDISPIYWNLISSYFLLIPKQDKLVFIASY